MSKSAKSKVYYSKKAFTTISVPVFNKSGEMVVKTDRHGQIVYNRHGEPENMTRAIKFSTVETSVERGPLSMYCIDDAKDEKYLIAYLDRLCEDPTNEVISEDVYKKTVNPTAYILQQQLEDKDGVIAEKDNKIAELMAKLADVESKITPIDPKPLDPKK